LSWTESAVIHDIKGENWQLTAGWRSRFSYCLLFNPTDPRSARYNPLLEVRKGPDEVRDVQNIADILVDPEGALERRSHWEKTSHSLLVGVILHVLYAEEQKRWRGSRASCPIRSVPLNKRCGHDGDQPSGHAENRPSCIRLSRRPHAKSSTNPKTSAPASCPPRCRSSASTAIRQWRDDVRLRLAHRRSGRCRATRYRLYLVIPPSDISRTKPLVRLISEPDRPLPDGAPGRRSSKSRKHKLLLMLDEFPALGRLDFFETALAFMAGYGIRAYLIAQSLNQITKAYGENNSILDNCHVRIAFASNDERTAKRISDALGHGDRTARPAQLCRTPAVALAESRHGLKAGDGPSAPNAR
jgi:type IV secretion system protein VirD4